MHFRDEKRFKSFGLEYNQTTVDGEQGVELHTKLVQHPDYPISKAFVKILIFDTIEHNVEIPVGESTTFSVGSLPSANFLFMYLAVEFEGNITKEFRIPLDVDQRVSVSAPAELKLQLGFRKFKVMELSYYTNGVSNDTYSVSDLIYQSQLSDYPNYGEWSELASATQEITADSDTPIRFQIIGGSWFGYFTNDDTPSGFKIDGNIETLSVDISKKSGFKILLHDRGSILFDIPALYTYKRVSYRVPADLMEVRLNLDEDYLRPFYGHPTYSEEFEGWLYVENLLDNTRYDIRVEKLNLKQPWGYAYDIYGGTFNKIENHRRCEKTIIASRQGTAESALMIQPSIFSGATYGVPNNFVITVSGPGLPTKVLDRLDYLRIDYNKEETNTFYETNNKTNKPYYTVKVDEYSMANTYTETITGTYYFDLGTEPFIPEITAHSFKDVNPITTTFTKNNQVIVQLQSDFEQKVSAAAKRFANIARINVRIGGRVYGKSLPQQNEVNNETLLIPGINFSGEETYEIEIVDTRGNKTTVYKFIKGLPYFKPIHVLNSTSRINGFEDDSYLNYTVRYSDLIKEHYSLKYRIKEEHGEWGDFINLTDWTVKDEEEELYFEVLENHFLGAKDNTKNFLIELVASDYFEDISEIIELNSGRGLAIIDKDGWAWQERIMGISANGNPSWIATMEDLGYNVMAAPMSIPANDTAAEIEELRAEIKELRQLIQEGSK